MKRKKTRYGLGQRFLAAAISFVMVFALLPKSMMAAAAVAAGEDGLASFDELVKPTTVPEEFSNPAYKDVNPYGYKLGEAFQLTAKNELLYYQTMQNTAKIAAVFSDLRLDDFDGNTTDREFSQLGNGAGSNSPFASGKAYTDVYGNLRFVRAVAFDPFKTGRDKYVAFLGLDPYTFQYGIFLMNSSNGDYSNMVMFGVAAAVNTNMEDNFSNNFLAITAGRYRGDTGNETIITYTVNDVGQSRLHEWEAYYDGSELKLRECTSVSLWDENSYLHDRYRKSGNKFATSNAMYNQLGVSLATGDFNNDLIDDLAVLSYTNDVRCEQVADNGLTMKKEFYTPYLTVALGKRNTDILGRNSGVNSRYIYIKNEDTEHEFISCTAPSVAAGDIDGDGNDELVVAGWRTRLKTTDDDANRKDLDLVDGALVGIYDAETGKLSEKMLKAYADVGENGNVVDSWAHKSKTWRDGDFNRDGDGTTMPQFAVACVALNGNSNPEYVFLNGNFRLYNSTEGDLQHKYTPDYFKNEDSSCHGMGIALGFISSMAVGVFDGNPVGREQIILSVGLWDDGDGNHKDDYTYMLGMAGGREYNDTANSYGLLGKYYTTGYDHGEFFGYEPYDYAEKEDYPFHNTGFNDYNRANCLVVAVDAYEDGIVASYSGKELVYSEPNLVAFLQASPYFEELGYYGGETEYTVGTNYTIGKTESNTTSFSVGFSTEVEAPGVRLAVGAGYSRDWAKSFDNYYTESHSMTFKSTEKNQVILQRTPIIVYCYELAGGGEIVITVPSAPVYTALSTDDYNAFVDQYNSSEHQVQLKKIGQKDRRLYLNEGSPELYFDNYGENRVRLSKDVSTGTGKGVSAASYEKLEGNTESEETSDGYYVDLSLGTGFSFPLGSVYAGVDTSVSGSVTRGSYTTTEQFYSVTGSVADPDSAESENIPLEICNQYGFIWSLCTWDIYLYEGGANKGKGIPVIGYIVNQGSIRRAVQSPTGLVATDGAEAGTVNLSWDAVEGATGYTLYLVNEEGEYEAVVDNIPGNSQSYKIPEDNRRPMLTFAVTATVKNSMNPNGVESMYSSKAYYYLTNQALSAYDIACQNGFQGTQAQWLLSLVGAAGQDGVDGVDGANGADGVGIQNIYVDDNTNYFTIELTNGDILTFGDISGADGTGIEDVHINDSGELVIQLSNGLVLNLGVIKGQDGKTPYIGENGNWWIGDTDTGVKAQGQDGVDGKPGVDGKTPYIGENGNWWIGDTDTGVKAQGQDGVDGKPGVDGKTPYIGSNGNWWIGDTDTGVTAQGKDGTEGQTPYIGTNGNWWIGWLDTGVQAAGKDGKPGADGLTPYIGSNGNWWIGNTDTLVKAEGKDGQAGQDGQPGADGLTPSIGLNGNWWIGDRDTLVPAAGKDGADGADGLSPHIGENGNWWVGGYDTGVKAEGRDGADGKDGLTPYIGLNGNWWIGDTDTGVPAAGLDGKPGADGADGKDGLTPYIGSNGNWWIGNTDTLVKAEGKDGADGLHGLTPYIGLNGNWWISDRDTLVPATGKDGQDGTDGKDGLDGLTPHIGENGNWWIGGFDTGEKAIGLDGKPGADGSDGADGKDGLTPYIGENGNWWIGNTDTQIAAAGKDGTDGRPGADGKDGVDGLTPYIGENGNWWIGQTDTHIAAAGKDGADGKPGADGTDGKDGVDGLTPYIGSNGHWWIGNVDTLVKAEGQDGKPGADGSDGADGKDGLIPYIGENGNWWIGDRDTLVPAAGKDGQDGKPGADGTDGKDGLDGLTPHIGENGNWWIGGYDTGVRATGLDGKPGADGKDGVDGKTPYIGENGNWWIGDRDTLVPAAGKDGQDGADGRQIELRVYNGYIQWHLVGDEEWIDLIALEDIRGEAGADGADGKDGVDGTDGKDGLNGLTPHIGENGNWWLGEYDTTIPARGQDGADGKDGTDGKDGLNGKDGTDGKDGLNGKDGADGKDGLNGKDGADGKNGLNGKDGIDGKNGADGKNGHDGKDGKDGTSTVVYWLMGATALMGNAGWAITLMARRKQ